MAALALLLWSGTASAVEEPAAEGLGARVLEEVEDFAEELERGDPLERFNRATHGFNRQIDRYALDPFYRAYVGHVPLGVRKAVHNVFGNLQEPLVVINSAAVGDLENAGTASLRFAVNSTVGLLGIADVASVWELRSRNTDLGVTLCRYGLPPGPYLVLPILGPSSSRDMAGRVATHVALYGVIGDLFYPYYLGTQLSDYVDDRPIIDDAMAGALDSYARHRALFRQREAWRCALDPREQGVGAVESAPPAGRGAL